MKRALTVVEVLIAVIILGILAAIVIPQFTGVNAMWGNKENIKRVEAQVIYFGEAWLGGCGKREPLLLVRLPDGELVFWHPINPPKVEVVEVEPGQKVVRVEYLEYRGGKYFSPSPTN